jgi:hypothetical protein
VTDGDGEGEGDDEGGLDGLGFGLGGGVVAGDAAGHDEYVGGWADGLRERFDADDAADGEDGRRETCCISATECVAARGLGPPAARAVPAAASAAAAPIAMATCRPDIRRDGRVRSAALPGRADGVLDGECAASRRAAALRSERPRSCQSRP